ncbi:MAG: hypothetical protein G8345_16025 [Magnetococcales bacterium]|nr:sulfurtransferase TusA family protein [Magnetococcales bacterium]NGZ28382.1 hypothetical protein [Magnetococcales bacterium]
MQHFPANLMERYSRQLMLSHLGEEGQQRLGQATVLVVGIGGMAGTTLLYLAGAGIGTLLLLEPSQDGTFTAGHRLLQVTSQMGAPAVTIAAETLIRLNPTISVIPLSDQHHALENHLVNCSMVVVTEAGDKELQRINQLCMDHGIPLLHSRLQEGWVHVRHYSPLFGCLACQTAPPLLPMPGGPWQEEESWLQLAAGFTGCLLAQEVILRLTRTVNWSYLDHHVLSTSQSVGITHPQPGCPVCGGQDKKSQTLNTRSGPQVDDTIDITYETCPMTFVRVKLKLESMAPGSRLRIHLQGKEPLENVPRTLRHEGYQVEEAIPAEDGTWWLDAVKPLQQ